jgi:SAM-dependent methyltransferase
LELYMAVPDFQTLTEPPHRGAGFSFDAAGKGSGMPTPDDARSRAALTYNTAADFFDDPANSFWDRFGVATIERLGLAAGERVLDVCCGAGASALPAAERVGPAGRILGVDLAERLLELGRAKARARGLSNVELRVADMLELGSERASFDAVVCVFGIFFVPDMPLAVRTLWDLVRPGGRLAITTWGPRFFEPVTTVWWEAVRAERPELYKGFNPWDRVCDPESLRAVLRDGGVERAEIVAEPGWHPIPSPDACWAAVLGTGYRGTLEQLEPAARERVRAKVEAYVRDHAIREVETSVVYATATKPLDESARPAR